MFSMRRNQIIIAALVLMIGVAGYLNYLDTRNGGMVAEDEIFGQTTDGQDISAIVFDFMTGQEVPVIGAGANFTENETPVAQAPQDAAETEPGTAVFVSGSQDTSFFVQAKLTREQDRSRQKEALNGLINSAELDNEIRGMSAEAVINITGRMERESATEAALTAKGFGESYVRIDDNWVEVIISKSVITDQELAQLEDIVTRLTGAHIGQIRLSSVR